MGEAQRRPTTASRGRSIDERQPVVRLGKLSAEQLVAVYTSIGEQLGQLNAKSTAIRAVASAWLLAAVGAVGWSATNDVSATSLGVSGSVVAPAGLAVGVAGLLVLWALDRVFVYRLVEASFLVGVALERGYPDTLPPVMRLMSRMTSSRVVHVFYLLPSGILAVAGLVLILAAGLGEGPSIGTWVLASFPVLAFAAAVVVVIWALRSGKSNRERAVQCWNDLIGDLGAHPDAPGPVRIDSGREEVAGGRTAAQG